MIVPLKALSPLCLGIQVLQIKIQQQNTNLTCFTTVGELTESSDALSTWNSFRDNPEDDCRTRNWETDIKITKLMRLNHFMSIPKDIRCFIFSDSQLFSKSTIYRMQ